jgi:hypothetical protein
MPLLTELAADLEPITIKILLLRSISRFGKHLSVEDEQQLVPTDPSGNSAIAGRLIQRVLLPKITSAEEATELGRRYSGCSIGRCSSGLAGR